ncbi:MAG: excisionase family DNA-binding protein [Candidatus Adiutrix sp.]|nr:excisionase family DNA-binding protein [Candidatus Adiutrix sp.]
MEKRLNWKQACDILGCGKTKFYRLIRDKKLPAYRAGMKGIWVKEDDVFRLIETLESVDDADLM